MNSPPEQRYSEQEIRSIIDGYRSLDQGGRLSALMANITRCRQCHAMISLGTNKPINALSRPLPLPRLSDDNAFRNYCIKIKRDDTYLRHQFTSGRSAEKVIAALGPSKFSIGLLPWTDRCMLYKKNNGRTKLMVIGIDYKNFPPFFDSPRDHQFPLDSYRKSNNIWGPSWRQFWRYLLGTAEDSAVNHFIAENGVFFTNSMLCFGGSQDRTHHEEVCLTNCRSHIAELISIIRPDVLVSFGVLGLRNTVGLLLEQNPDHPLLKKLNGADMPFAAMEKAVKRGMGANDVQVMWEGQSVAYWPLYQPARPNRYHRDYEGLRGLLGVRDKDIG
ncbi:MAG: uracil-DNA glycosylase family protein [Pedobacter sp.]